ncbi:MAG: DUF134 domain-containing protein [Methanobrevibacter sp.]|nr:DUF134 domain-containing protein [Methanobrevibacter sp.]
MARPKIERRIVKKPDYNCQIHGDIETEQNREIILMNLDEFEAIRLGDYHNIKQKEAAELMGISQPTFHRIINSARKKTATSLIEGRKIEINNENFKTETKVYLCRSCGFQWNNPKKEYKYCPDCKSENIEIFKEENNKKNTNLQNETSENPVKDPIKDSKYDVLGDTEKYPLHTRKSFGGSGSGRGPSKACKCPNCGYEAPKIRGFPCRNVKCPECGVPLCGSKN